MAKTIQSTKIALILMFALCACPILQAGDQYYQSLSRNLQDMFDYKVASYETESPYKKEVPKVAPAEQNYDAILDEVNADFFSEEHASNVQKQVALEKPKATVPTITPPASYINSKIAAFFKNLPWFQWQQEMENPCWRQHKKMEKINIPKKRHQSTELPKMAIPQKKSSKISEWVSLAMNPHNLSGKSYDEWTNYAENMLTGRQLRK